MFDRMKISHSGLFHGIPGEIPDQMLYNMMVMFLKTAIFTIFVPQFLVSLLPLHPKDGPWTGFPCLPFAFL